MFPSIEDSLQTSLTSTSEATSELTNEHAQRLEIHGNHLRLTGIYTFMFKTSRNSPICPILVIDPAPSQPNELLRLEKVFVPGTQACDGS